MPIKVVRGDATCPQGKGNKIVMHVCNTLGKWGNGFVMAVSDRWPETREKYLMWFKEGSQFALGGVQFIQVKPDIYVANMVAQKGIKTGSGGPPIRYDSLAQCLEQ